MVFTDLFAGIINLLFGVILQALLGGLLGGTVQ